MILITSGAFVTSEFQAEVGQLPPAFLPLGNRRLYEHQIRALRRSFPNNKIYLSLTDAYIVRKTDERVLADLDVQLVFVPDGLALGDSLLYAINSIGMYDDVLRVLHGDTYLETFPLEDDVIALAQPDDDYAWEAERGNGDRNVWCGYFAFSDIKLLAQSLTRARGKFVEGVRQYRKVQQLQLSNVTNWFDLGHVNTYFRSRARFTTQRSFNELKIVDGVVYKASLNAKKIRAEAKWFEMLPFGLKRFAPQLLHFDENAAQYCLEYLPLMPLNELFVHCSLPLLFWRKIHARADTLLKACEAASGNLACTELDEIELGYRSLILQKTDERLLEYAETTGTELDAPTFLNGVEFPSLGSIARECQAAALSVPRRPGVMHGDFCFSNILYDSRGDTLKFIDPRGVTGDGRISLTGDLRYDIAKFFHSSVGLYDYIVADRFALTETSTLSFQFAIHVDSSVTESNESVASILEIGAIESLPIVVLLFLSMLPLHSDDARRQRAFVANALRLYSKWRKSKCS